MIPGPGTVVTETRDQHQQLRAQRRNLLVVAAVALIALLGTLAWATYHSGDRSDVARAEGRHRGGDAGRAIPVRVAAATTGSVDRTVEALGTVTALNTVTVRSRVDGPLVDVPFHEGRIVRAGDLLARIDPRTFQVTLEQAEGQLARDESQLAGARVDLERYRDLLAKDSISKQQVDTQTFMVRQLEGTVRADHAQVDNARLQLDFTRITAPFAGRVGLRQVDPGNVIHASDTNGLVVLTQTHPINVVFAVPSDRLREILPHWRKADPLVVDALDRDNKWLAQGNLAAIDNQIDVTTGTINLKAQFVNNDDALFPSQFVNTRLTIETLTGVTLVPSAAVQRGASVINLQFSLYLSLDTAEQEVQAAINAASFVPVVGCAPRLGTGLELLDVCTTYLH